MGVDAIGALLSGLSLLWISFLKSELFGLPTVVYRSLAAFAFGLVVFSGVGYISFPKRFSFFLRMTISLNGGYILYTASFLSNHLRSMTAFDWVYFPVELSIIGVLIVTEVKAFNSSAIAPLK